MFIWLASYPKSGNTLLRAMLSAYFFSDDGNFKFDHIKSIKQFPQAELFTKLKINLSNNEMIKNYINVQSSVNIKNSIQFSKTHSSFFNINNSKFTDLNNTLGVLYIVRDPRNVVTSFAKFNCKSVSDSADYLIKENYLQHDIPYDKTKKFYIRIGSWKENYNSWKELRSQGRYLLIKYEDLVDSKEAIFIKILKFVCKLSNSKFILNQKKIDNVIKSTSFEKMRDLEKNLGFEEAKINPANGEKINFFNLGKKNNWQNLLDGNIRKKIEKSFENEMKELGYL